MTILHLFANYKAVTSLVFETLNKDRLLEVLKSYYEDQDADIPRPEEVNSLESPFVGFGKSETNYCGKSIFLGAPFKPQHHSHQIQQIRKDFDKKQYSILETEDGSLNVILSSGASSKDCLKAYTEAFFKAYYTKPSFNFDSFEEKLIKSGWNTSHLQMKTLGWKGDFL